MDKKQAQLEEKLQALRIEYRHSLPERMKNIRRAAANLQPDDATQLRELRRHAHNLAGSGTTFNYPDISAAASKLEELLDQLMAQKKNIRDYREKIIRLIEEIGDTIDLPAE